MRRRHHPLTRQALVDEYLESDAAVDGDTVEGSGDESKPDAPTDNMKEGVDPTVEVFVSDRRYHTNRYGIPGCPEACGNLVLVPIIVAARRHLDPCEKCNPVEYRSDQDDSQPQNASLEAFL